MVAYAALLLLWSETLGIPNDTVEVFLWLWLGTVAWNIEAQPRYHLNFLKDWWIPVVGLVIYFFTRGLTDELGLPVHVYMPIHVDEWIGVGQTPTERLQHALCGNPCVRTSEPRWYDVFFTTVYATHFVTGLTIAAVLWVRNRAEWIKWMRRYVIINFGALVDLHRLPDGAALDGLRAGLAARRRRPDHRPGLARHRPGPDGRGAPGRRQPGRGDAVAARRHHLPDRDLRHPAAALPVALAARALPARDVAPRWSTTPSTTSSTCSPARCWPSWCWSAASSGRTAGTGREPRASRRI